MIWNSCIQRKKKKTEKSLSLPLFLYFFRSVAIKLIEWQNYNDCWTREIDFSAHVPSALHEYGLQTKLCASYENNLKLHFNHNQKHLHALYQSQSIQCRANAKKTTWVFKSLLSYSVDVIFVFSFRSHSFGLCSLVLSAELSVFDGFVL